MAFPQWMRRAARERRRMRMANTFTVPSMDTDGFGAPPPVEFEIGEDRHSMQASPPGATISIYSHDVRSDGTFQSRVVIRDTAADVVAVDMVLAHVPEPRWEEWENKSYYAAETSCGLYWSMWRRNKARERDGD